MKKFLCCILFLSLFIDYSLSQNSDNKSIYQDYQNMIKSIDKNDINNVITETALYFLGCPYVGSTLDSNNTEQLVINLNKFDCSTFMETVIALSLDYVSENSNYQNFENKLKYIRYRNGIMNGYTSRLHYSSDWIYDNIQKHNIIDRSKELGGIRFKKQLNFMSLNPQYYNALKNSPQTVDSIRIIEKNINNRHILYYIPVDKISNIESKIESGNVILITTSKEGLDYGHVGFAYRKDGVLKFIHASSDYKQVVISQFPLAEYLKRIKKFTGISVMKIIK
ncbi:MAG: DUF1460 domain-containing protein [Bacteroidales bacterium]|nr:DUF1460 domain-containing protein [Bacteroidales bacterium]